MSRRKLRLGHACRKATRRKMHLCHHRLAGKSKAGTESGSNHSWNREHWALAGTATLMTALCVLALPTWANAIKLNHPTISTSAEELSIKVPENTAEQAPIEPEWQQVTVKKGQTLSKIFADQGVAYKTLQAILQANKKDKALTQPHPGDVFYFLQDQNGQLTDFRYDADLTHRITLSIDHKGAVTRHVEKRHLEHRQQVAHGTIKSSFFGAAQDAGISEAVMVKMADIFKYDIDFIKDVDRGDHFSIVYDALYQDGEFLKTNKILAAEFTHKGKRHTAYAYKDDSGKISYYSKNGQPLRKPLMRTPVKFTRISSRFSNGRKHPVLGYTRAHKGVDYAAPTGTPIHAAGDGVIVSRGWVRGYGNYIKIKHNGKYSTAYAHMSSYDKHYHKGSHVKQGDVIGYVGMTGLATGPHLHYEVLINNSQVNPLAITMPKPEPMRGQQLAQFKAQTQPYVARLQRLDNNLQLAKTFIASRDDYAG